MSRKYNGPSAMYGVFAAFEAMFAVVAVVFIAVGIAVVSAIGFGVYLALKFTGVL